MRASERAGRNAGSFVLCATWRRNRDKVYFGLNDGSAPSQSFAAASAGEISDRPSACIVPAARRCRCSLNPWQNTPAAAPQTALYATRTRRWDRWAKPETRPEPRCALARRPDSIDRRSAPPAEATQPFYVLVRFWALSALLTEPPLPESLAVGPLPTSGSRSSILTTR